MLGAVGGKGASLARLAAAGLPVPDGFHVTTAAYRRFVAENELQPRILATLGDVDPAQPATFEAASQAIGRLFAGAAIPGDPAAAVVSAYADLNRQSPIANPRLPIANRQLAVAVRSSATAEDLPELSFAGQQETFLNVSGEQAVLEAVKQCWASLWTARAIAYRIRNGIDQATVALAVVVQVLVPAEAAGVMFTANAVTGRRDEIVINAAWGLGEAVVGGRVTPDTLTLDKASGRVLSRDTADKHVMTVQGAGGAPPASEVRSGPAAPGKRTALGGSGDSSGVREQPTPEHLRRAPVLDDAAAAELARLGVQIEQMYGGPMDVEWARAEGRFAILQARPITRLAGPALPEPEAPIPTGWPLPGKGPFFRGSIVDLLPDPVSPLFATLGRDRYNEGMKQVMQWFIGDPNARMTWLDVINGYAYMSMSLSPGNLLRILLAVPSFPRLIRESVSRWRDEVVPHYTATVATWRARRLSEVPAAALWGGVREIYDETIDHLTTLQAGLIGGAGAAESMLKNVYNLLARRPGGPATATLVLGYDSAPVRAQQALYDLGCWVGGQAELADYVRRRPTPGLAADLAGLEPPAGIDPDAWRALQARWQAYLDQHGAMIYTLDFAQPLPADEPAPLLETLKLYLDGQLANPYERQQGLAGRREAAVQSVLGRLKGLRRKAFTAVLRWAQRMAPVREDAIALIGHGYPQLRRMLIELGGRLAQAGAIDGPADIFWLTESEVEGAAAALDRGEPLVARQAVVHRRRAEWRAQKRLSPPPVLPPTKRFFLGRANMGGLRQARGGAQAVNTIKGNAVSPGRVTAPACVLRGPEDFPRMQAGHVLVAETTTPAWTPLFAMAAAVVTDIGGPLSHGSIVAREYDIPAVMGTGVATQRIGSGQVITVDGDAGTVTAQETFYG